MLIPSQDFVPLYRGAPLTDEHECIKDASCEFESYLYLPLVF